MLIIKEFIRHFVPFTLKPFLKR